METESTDAINASTQSSQESQTPKQAVTTSTGAEIHRYKLDQFMNHGRSVGGKTLSDIYPYKTLEVGMGIAFDPRDNVQRRHANTVRTYAIKHGNETGKKFSFRELGDGKLHLVRTA